MRTADKFAAVMEITPRHADYLGKGDRVASPELAMRALDRLGLDPVMLLDPKRRTRPLWDVVEECLAKKNHPLASAVAVDSSPADTGGSRPERAA